MRRHPPLRTLCATLGGLIGLLWPAVVMAQSPDPGGLGRLFQSLRALDIPVDISADELKYDRIEDRLIANGNLRLTQGQLSLAAERATLHRPSGRLTVDGPLRLTDGEDTIQAGSLVLDLNTQTGVLTDGRIFLAQDHYHVTGRSIERLADQRYRLEWATITTCDWEEGERPAWLVRARRLTIRPEQYLTARNVVVAVKGVPILYLPYLIWPVKTERQTGLLQPRLGYSTSEGLKIRQPLYLTLGPSQDATLTMDVRTGRGIGGALEYRYRLSRRSRGQVDVEVFHDRITQSLRTRLATTQTIDFNDRLSLRMDGEYVSDDDVLEDLSSVTTERTRRTLESNLFLTYHDAYQAMTLLTRYTRDLSSAVDESVQLLPALEYRLVGARAWSAPLFLSVQGSAVNFWRRTGLSVQRADLFPVLVWRQEAPLGLVITPRVGLRETIYSRDALGGDPTRRDLGVAGLGIAHAARRAWSRSDGGSFVHAVEPAVLYTYIGERRRENTPRLDEIDDIPEQSLVTATLTNRLLIDRLRERTEAEPQELVWVRLTQSYRVARRADPISTAVPAAWSALRGEATLRPHRALQVDLDTFYDYERDTFAAFNVDARVAWMPYADLSVGHRSRLHGSLQDPLPRVGDVMDPLALGRVATEPTEEIDYDIVSAHAYLARGFTLANTTYYNRRTHAFTEIDYGVQYVAQCWSIAFTYQDFPEENEFGVLLTLVGATSVDSKMASSLFARPKP